MAFSDYFVGVPQSRWAGYAILAAIIAVALAILFGKDHIPIGQRVVVILIMFVFALPTIVLVLFQLTCLVNGTTKGPYCGWYAWIVAVITILYCILLIIVAITVKSTDEYAKKTEKFVSFEEANKFAKGLLSQGGFEMFEDMAEKDNAEGFVDEEAEETEETEETEEPVEPFVDEKKKKMAVAEGFNTMVKKQKNLTESFNDMKKKVENFATASMPSVDKKDKKDTEAFADYAPVMENANMYML